MSERNLVMDATNFKYEKTRVKSRKVSQSGLAASDN